MYGERTYIEVDANQPIAEQLPENIIFDSERFAKAYTIKPNHHYIMSVVDGSVATIATLFEAENNCHLEYIETAQNTLNAGHAKALLEHIFDAAEERGKCITTNGFSRDGKSHLLRVMERLNTDRDREMLHYIPGA